MADTFGESEAEFVGPRPTARQAETGLSAEPLAQTNVAGRDTFVVRIWSSDDSGVLRGHVQHIRSRKRAYFASRQRLMSFIQDHLQRAERDTCRN